MNIQPQPPATDSAPDLSMRSYELWRWLHDPEELGPPSVFSGPLFDESDESDDEDSPPLVS